jgi:hypothetical protein
MDKAAGPDGLVSESFIFGTYRLYTLLTVLFNVCLKTAYLPAAFMQSVIVPLVKNKSGDLSDIGNYRAIALSTSISKILESVLFQFVLSVDDIDKCQFGFKQGHSTTICTNVLKSVIGYYTSRGSHVFTCFVDFTKAFDRVNYWKLFNGLLDDGVNVYVVKLLTYWYSNQDVAVKWLNVVSKSFKMGNGTRQGGLLSPYFFATYLRNLLRSVYSTRVGCNVGGMFFNILAYADDIVLIAPSWYALQELIDTLQFEASKIDMIVNVNKTCCMVFNPKDKNKIIACMFKQFLLDGKELIFVKSFKYLGHILSDDFSDDNDVKREIRNLFIRANILNRRFRKCSKYVKIRLYRAFCLCLYGSALWNTCSCNVKGSFKSCFNQCMKLVFGYRKFDSVTAMLLDVGLPSYCTILHNFRVSFTHNWKMCDNALVQRLCSLCVGI